MNKKHKVLPILALASSSLSLSLMTAESNNLDKYSVSGVKQEIFTYKTEFIINKKEITLISHHKSNHKHP